MAASGTFWGIFGGVKPAEVIRALVVVPVGGVADVVGVIAGLFAPIELSSSVLSRFNPRTFPYAASIF